MHVGRSLTIVGVVLIGLAFVLAFWIPRSAHGDFDALVKSYRGQSLRHSVDFPDIYRQMGVQRRMLQNFYIGASGLICLTVGLVRWTAAAERDSDGM